MHSHSPRRPLSPHSALSPRRSHSPHAHEHVSITPITPTILLGDLASSYSISTLITYSVTAIVSLGLYPSPEWSRPGNLKLVPEQNHMFVRCDDSATEDLLCHFTDICNFIEAQTAEPDLLRILEQVEEDSMRMGYHNGGDDLLGLMERGKVLVHCSQGVSRSPTVVVAYLMRKQKRGADAVLADVKVKRWEVDPNENFMEQLRIWEKVGYDIWEDKERKVPKMEYKKFLEKREETIKREKERETHLHPLAAW